MMKVIGNIMKSIQVKTSSHKNDKFLNELQNKDIFHVDNF